MAAFLEVRFPVHISRGSRGGPDWAAEIVARSSGYEERNTPWSAPLHYYDAAYGVRTQDELHEVKSLYLAAMGRLKGFRFKDWADYKSCEPLQSPSATDQAIGTGDGEETSFQLIKTYTFAGQTFVRTIAKPVSGTVLIALGGTPQGSGWTVDATTGVVTFSAAPGNGVAVTAGFEFDVPVRFDGRLDAAVIDGPHGGIPSIPLKELRL